MNLEKKEEDGRRGPRLADRKICTGCGACAGVCPVKCIEMKPDENGFFYPAADLNVCISCRACERTCPLLQPAPGSRKLPEAYAAYSLDEDVRRQSSSGGIFSEIAQEVLSEGGAVYGAAYDDGCAVYHRAVEKPGDLDLLRRAKYAESRLGNTFPEIRERLERGQTVLFSGTPCQVAGLRAFLQKDYDRLWCIDFVCHGVPSPAAWDRYIDYIGEKDGESGRPSEINMRDKISGWSRYRYSNVFRYPDGKEHRDISTQSLYMTFFINGCITRFSCGDCRFKGYGRASDITLGDFWGIWDIVPEMDDDQGISAVLIHTEKGREIWGRIRNRIRAREVSLEESSSQNPAMTVSAVLHSDREKILKVIREKGFEKAVPLLSLKRPVWKRITGKLLRTFRS